MRALTGVDAPSSIRIEASSHCQLRCPSCPTAAGVVRDNIGAGLLEPELLAALLDENPTIQAVELSNYGEAFLNPRLVDILKLCHGRGVATSLRNGVNLNAVRDETLQALVRFRLQAMTISMDGVTQETYSQYRRRGDLATVLSNIRRINELKEIYGSDLPRLTIQFIVFGFNEHEIESAKALARELRADIRFKASWDADLSPVRDSERVARSTGLKRIYESDHKLTQGPTALEARLCSQLWKSPQIHSDGAVLGCCVNLWSSFGSVREYSLDEVVNGEKMRYARGMLLGQVPPREDIPCFTCHNYRKMHEQGIFLTEAMVADPDSAERVETWWHPLARAVVAPAVRTKRGLARAIRRMRRSRESPN